MTATGIKTEKEKFAGAETTYTVESLMYNGVTLQSATSHYFGQKFSKAYDIKFLNRENQLEYAYQTSWGASTRMIGGLIMVHSDDFGLVLPPKIAPKQVVIVPIGTDETVMNLSDEICQKLNSNGIVAFVDKTERSPGFKFAEHEVCVASLCVLVLRPLFHTAQVFIKHAQGITAAVNKHNLFRASANGLYPKRTTARKQVKARFALYRAEF